MYTTPEEKNCNRDTFAVLAPYKSLKICQNRKLTTQCKRQVDMYTHTHRVIRLLVDKLRWIIRTSIWAALNHTAHFRNPSFGDETNKVKKD